MRFKSLMLLAAACPTVASAAEPLRLQPAGPWQVNYADNSCQLLRTFGEAPDRIIFGLESTAPDQMDMMIAGKPLATGAEEVSATFLPTRGEGFKGTVIETADRHEPAILWSDVRMVGDATYKMLERRDEESRRRPNVRPPAIDQAERARIRSERQSFAAATTGLEILARRNSPVVLETGSLGAPMAAFEKCSRDSLRDWGVDPDLDSKIVRRVWAANPKRWFSAKDYPDDLAWKGQQADVTVRVLVNAAGQVTRCTSVSHFKEKRFDEITCAKFSSRAKFEPAELADGTKVPSYYVKRVIFRLAR